MYDRQTAVSHSVPVHRAAGGKWHDIHTAYMMHIAAYRTAVFELHLINARSTYHASVPENIENKAS